MNKKKDDLERYRAKRNFSRTPEPAGDEGDAAPGSPRYLIQKHAASHLHYDFRLELDGVLKSWAVPKGPSLDPSDKRLAMHVEDHPLAYGDFEGIIPKGEYGGGTVMLWDAGSWEPQGDPLRDYRRGRLTFRLKGERLQGLWALSRMGSRSSEGENKWLLIKKRDDHARSDFDVTEEETVSVATGRTMEEIADSESPAQWNSNRKEAKEKPAPLASIDLREIAGARRGEPPKEMRPQLATLVQKAPRGEGWVHEIKYDGYRILCTLEDGKARLISRNGKDWTDRFGEIAEAAARLPIERGVVDGEIGVTDAQGATDFQALQNALRNKEGGKLVYFVFDLPYLEGWDLTEVPLSERKALLARLAPSASEAETIRYSDHISGSGEAVFRNACRFALEGVVSKRAESPYRSRRTDSWRKVKCLNRQEFVVAGWTDPGGGGTGLGSLILGLYDEQEKFVYAGRVGTGFSTDLRRELAKRLAKRERSDSPFDREPQGEGGKGVHWAEPEMVAEVEFTSWTRDGRLRHPSFKGLREDKAPEEIRREPSPAPPDKPGEQGLQTPARKQREEPSGAIGGVVLSNPERVLYPEQGVTKEALARYYEKVAPMLLPHIAKRPLTLVRCPRGHQKKCFYQRHYNDTLPPHLRAVSIEEKGGKAPYLLIDDLAGLISLVQMGVLEIHPWGSREDRLERPDRVVFDLDPGPEVSWKRVVEAARRVGGTLEELGLRSFVKTTGGKGLHVVVPLQRRSDWDEMKEFARAVARRLAQEEPQNYVAVMSKSKRPGKIFIDYLRNSRGATSVAPFVTRALPGAPVSTPLAWDELSSLSGARHYTVENLPRRLAHLDRDPWEGFFDLRQSLTRKIREALGY